MKQPNRLIEFLRLWRQVAPGERRFVPAGVAAQLVREGVAYYVLDRGQGTAEPKEENALAQSPEHEERRNE